MIAGLKPYPKMKDSGVEWLGQVPAHWEVRKVRDVARVVHGYPFESARFSRSAGVPLIRIRDLNKTRTAVRYDGPFVESARVSPGDVLIGMDGDFNVGTWRGSEPALLNQRMCCVRSPNRTTKKLLAYLLPQPLKEINDVTWSTTVKHLSGRQVERIQIPLPPLSEQTAIVRFLDYVDRRSRRYIRAKQKLIKLLEEYKQALIHQAVTGRIDVRTSKPYPEYKDSGVEWLGQVPAHWEVVALKRVLTQLVDCEHKTAPSVEQSDFRVVRTAAVRGGRIRWEGTYCTSADAFEVWTQRAVPEPGDVIFTREAPAGEACLVPKDARVCLGQRTVLMKVQRGGYDPEFLVHMIYAGPPRIHIQLTSQGSTVGHFNMDDIGRMKVLKPPLDEQQTIGSHIERETEGLNNAIEHARREIELLEEFRTRLIADVVTGKLDVRDVAARLPEESEEPEPLDERESDAEEIELADGLDDTAVEVDA